jgi:hypothetical protein
VAKGLGISAVAIAAFVVFMAAGAGRAAEPSVAVKAPVTKQASPSATPPATKEGAPGAAKETPVKPSVVADATAKADKTSRDAKPPEGAQKSKDSKDANATGPKPTEGEAKDAQRTVSAAAVPGQRRTKAKRKRDGSLADAEPELPPGQGPPPPSPLTVNDLHQEANRERGPAGDFNAPPRVKLEQLLSELGRARQSLHDDTVKLEALAGNEPSRGGESTSGDAPPATAPGAPGQPAQKNPLDVLAKALRGIKPEQAGPIVARLDKGLAATVLLKMPPADAGKIMGALKPEVAAELATQIAMRAPSPQPGGKR